MRTREAKRAAGGREPAASLFGEADAGYAKNEKSAPRGRFSYGFVWREGCAGRMGGGSYAMRTSAVYRSSQQNPLTAQLTRFAVMP